LMVCAISAEAPGGVVLSVLWILVTMVFSVRRLEIGDGDLG
jgi:hypothetical protein